MLNLAGKNRGLEHDFTDQETQVVQESTDGLPLPLV